MGVRIRVGVRVRVRVRVREGSRQKAFGFEDGIVVIDNQHKAQLRASQGRPFLPLLPWDHGTKQQHLEDASLGAC